MLVKDEGQAIAHLVLLCSREEKDKEFWEYACTLNFKYQKSFHNEIYPFSKYPTMFDLSLSLQKQMLMEANL